VAAASGIPYAFHTRSYAYLNHPETGRPIPESVVCTVAAGSMPTVRTMFEASTLVLFVCPIVLITVLYTLIGIKLKVTSPEGRVGGGVTATLIQRRASTVAERRRHKSRINVIKMLGISLLALHHQHYVAQWKNVGLWPANFPWPAPYLQLRVTIYVGKPSAVG